MKELSVSRLGGYCEVAKTVVGEKMIVYGRAARWWDAEVKVMIEHRRDIYKGQDDLREEYFKLCKFSY